MSQSAKAQEPSMEEILASIRRIIADEEAARAPEPRGPAGAAAPSADRAKNAAAAPARETANRDEIDAMLAEMEPGSQADGRAPGDDAPDILELTEPLAAPPEPPPVFRPDDRESDVFVSDTFPEPPAGREGRPSALAESALMSSATSAAVDAAFKTLTQTVLAQNNRSLEDLVTETMRPMLKAWLDENLPGLVERVVRAEIERVSRGR